MNVCLGDKVKDPLTGIAGFAYSYITYLYGCERIGIQQAKFKSETGAWVVPDIFYVDEPQLEVIERCKSKVHKKDIPLGGPSGFEVSHKSKI